MERLLAATLAVVVILACFMGLASNLTDKQTSRMYARAHLVEVKSAASQALLIGMMPYVVLGIAVIGGTVAVIALTWPRPMPPTRAIERKVVIILLQPEQAMLQPEQTRHEYWSQSARVIRRYLETL